MITIQDLYNIVGNKIANEAQKALIRYNFPPHIAEQLCDAIDRKDNVDMFNRIMTGYNEWLAVQKRQQQYLQQFLREYYR